MEKFYIRKYTEDKHPTIIGNGFDGLIIGKDRREAQEFTKFINYAISAYNKLETEDPER